MFEQEGRKDAWGGGGRGELRAMGKSTEPKVLRIAKG